MVLKVSVGLPVYAFDVTNRKNNKLAEDVRLPFATLLGLVRR